MTTAVHIYKHGIKLGEGTCAAGSATVSSWTATSGAPDEWRKNVQVQIIGASAWTGEIFQTRVLTDNTTSLVLKDVCPFVGA